ncbi:hypothetical protein [Aeoliella sp.]|uniref:hypothetical protein n=1 Tax=Aeoliella sp. TaxID=2795800 RepID=UPI003CCBC739
MKGSTTVLELKNIMFGIVEAMIRYFFLWYFLTTLMKDSNLWVETLILLVPAYSGFVACPWRRETEAWKQM